MPELINGGGGVGIQVPWVENFLKDNKRMGDVYQRPESSLLAIKEVLPFLDSGTLDGADRVNGYPTIEKLIFNDVQHLINADAP